MSDRFDVRKDALDARGLFVGDGVEGEAGGGVARGCDWGGWGSCAGNVVKAGGVEELHIWKVGSLDG